MIPSFPAEVTPCHTGNVFLGNAAAHDGGAVYFSDTAVNSVIGGANDVPRIPSTSSITGRK